MRRMEERTSARIADLELERRGYPVDLTLSTPGAYAIYERWSQFGGATRETVKDGATKKKVIVYEKL